MMAPTVFVPTFEVGVPPTGDRSTYLDGEMGMAWQGHNHVHIVTNTGVVSTTVLLFRTGPHGISVAIGVLWLENSNVR